MSDDWKILISDEISEEGVALIRREGLQVEVRTGLQADEVRKAIPPFHGLIVRSQTKVTAELLAAAPLLKVVVRAGVGVDNIDVAAATRRGIVVMNTPEGNTVSAAEHTWALLLSMARNIPRANQTLKEGRWDRAAFTGVELAGKTLGIVGLGKVGREVARRARGFGMEVVGFDPFCSEELAAQQKITLQSYDEVVRRADFITFHVPLTDQTRGIFGEREIAMARPGIRVINCSRGGIVDEAALQRGIRDGKVAGAALDVFEKEPPTGNPLLALDRVVVTPHLGASTVEAMENVGIESARLAVDFLQHGAVKNAVNTVTIDPKLLERVGPFRELVERLGSLHAQLLAGKLREIRIDYSGEPFDPPAQRFLTAAMLTGFLSHYLHAPVNYVNAAHFARENRINIVESNSLFNEGFSVLVTVSMTTDQGARTLAGTLFGNKGPRLVRLDEYPTEIAPVGHMLLFSNDDRPGMIGMVGTVLGDARVNIANMSMGRDLSGGHALAILNVDEQVPAEVLKDLATRPGILWVKAVKI